MKVIVVTPAGRKRYLKILLKNLQKQKNDFDEWHLWENTRNKEDEIYIKELEKEYEWIKCVSLNWENSKVKKGETWGISRFFDYIDEKNMYVRFDDDILFIEDNFIKNIIKFRINNPKYSIVYGNIVNNNLIDHIHQRMGALDLDTNINYECMGNGWNSKTIPINIHIQFIEDIKKNNLEKWKFSKWELNNFERVSINCLCWKGSDMNNFKFMNTNNGNKKVDEEHEISVEQPRSMGIPAVIYGGSLVSHGAFYRQRTPELEELLQEYNNL